MEKALVLVLGICALPGASAVSPCLDPTDASYKCENLSGSSELLILDDECAMTDEDVDSGDLAACLDTWGREYIMRLWVRESAITTLPEDFLHDLPVLHTTWMDTNQFTTLPEGIFQDLPALESIWLDGNNFTTLPEGIFQDIPVLRIILLHDNAFSAVPKRIFQNITTLETIRLDGNALTALPEGIFQDLPALESIYLSDNDLTTLPKSLFQDIPLVNLELEGNALECLPSLPSTLVEVDDDATGLVDGLWIDAYGDECGCSIPDVSENVCGEETCTPGPEGYTCGTLAASITASPVPAPTPTSSASTPAPSSGINSTTSPATAATEQKSDSDSTPIVAGVVSAVAGAALIALAVFLSRRRASKQEITPPPAVSSTHDDANLEQGPEQPPDVCPPPYSAVIAEGDAGDKPPSQEHKVSPHRPLRAEAHGADGGGIAPPVVPASLDGQVQSSAGHANNAAEDGVAGIADEDAEGGSAGKLLAATPSIATASTANMSTTERDEVAQFRHRESLLGAASVDSGPAPEKAPVGGAGASSAADRQSSAGDIGLGSAVLAAAQELAHHCQIPGVSEAAGAVCMMVNLATDSRDNVRAGESRLRQCRSIVLALKRAGKVAGRGGDTAGELARALIEDVHDAIFDLVQLIKTFKSKNKLSKLFMSTLFKRRQEELDAVVNQAIMRLQLGLQLQVGQDVSAMKEGMALYQHSLSESTSETVAEARRIKRQRKLDQVEIPEEHLFITDELLGKGGFGEVYLADYNGHNAAAKVLYIAHDVGALDENQKQRETSQRRGFLRELEAMIRLRSLNTVNVFGAVTSLSDRMVLVMELLAGGDLLTLLKKSKKPLPEDQTRRIIRDICTGMAFLHSKNTVHGDLKSANVLLDGDGRAKIADFGTSRWTQHTNSTGLATYTTKSSQTTQMSIAWSAPEVLDSERSSYASDVYSFGIVVWEVLSRELPWANKTRPSEILTAVLRGVRPSFHVDAPADVVDIARACWDAKPEERPKFSAILEGMNSE